MILASILLSYIVRFVCGTETEVMVTSEACFDATDYETDYQFSPPYDGTIVGMKLVHTDGLVKCMASESLNSYWGCNTVMHVQLIEEGVGVVYPISTTDGITSWYDFDCANGRDCQVYYWMLSGYGASDDELIYMDTDSPYSVETTQVFSLQYGEGCCEYDHYDNTGTACAQVYFYYSEYADAEKCSERGATGLSQSHACQCQSECGDGDSYCNTIEFVADRLGDDLEPNDDVLLCPNEAKDTCCCSCPNCAKNGGSYITTE